MDDLIERLRARAADPERRVEVRRGTFGAEIRTLSLGQLVARTMDTRQALSRVVGAVREGRVPDADIHERADRIRDELSRRVMPELPAIASPAAIADLEAELAAPLPAVLRRAYLEVANGGFGPGGGLMALEASMRRYRELRVSPQGPRHEPWLEKLLPLVDEDPGCVCIDLSTGRIVRWDPEEMADRQNGRTWKRSFIEIEPHAEAWLEKWLSTPTFEERMAVRMAKSNLVEACLARARVAAMTPEERKAMGLPEVGWERVVWGGIGLDDDDPNGPSGTAA